MRAFSRILLTRVLRWNPGMAGGGLQCAPVCPQELVSLPYNQQLVTNREVRGCYTHTHTSQPINLLYSHAHICIMWTFFFFFFLCIHYAPHWQRQANTDPCGQTQSQSNSWIIQLCLAGHTALQPFIWQLANAGEERWEVLLDLINNRCWCTSLLPAFCLERQFCRCKGVKCGIVVLEIQ